MNCDDIVQELMLAQVKRIPIDLVKALDLYDDKILEYNLMTIPLSQSQRAEIPSADDYALSFVRDYIWFGEA